MDHQVEHDIHVEAARGEDAHAMNFEEKRQSRDALRRVWTAGLNCSKCPTCRMRLFSVGGFN